MTIQDAIRQMATAGMEIYCKVCTVDAVDEKARTVDCSPLDEGAPLLGVNLQANQESEHGVVLFPVVGSYVVVAFVGQSVAVVVLSEKVDKIQLKIGKASAEITDGVLDATIDQTTIKINSDGLIINGGQLGGLVISQNVVNKFNALENDINALKTVFSTWVPVVQDGGAALKTVVTTWATDQLTTTVGTDLENNKVKH